MADLKPQIGCLTSRTDVNQEQKDTLLEETKAWRKKDVLPRSDRSLSRKGESQPREDEGRPGRNGGRGECLRRKIGQKDTTNLKANQEKSEAVAVHQEVPKEEVEVETVGALEGRNGDRRLAVRRRGRQEKEAQSDCGSRQKLVAARGRLTRRAVPALRK
jgi:hypothetical protein